VCFHNRQRLANQSELETEKGSSRIKVAYGQIQDRCVAVKNQQDPRTLGEMEE
jgi:hypothetical protein